MYSSTRLIQESQLALVTPLATTLATQETTPACTSKGAKENNKVQLDSALRHNEPRRKQISSTALKHRFTAEPIATHIQLVRFSCWPTWHAFLHLLLPALRVVLQKKLGSRFQEPV